MPRVPHLLPFQDDQTRQLHFLRRWYVLCSFLILFVGLPGLAQRTGGRGAMSAQDMAKMAAGPLASTGVLSCPALVDGSTVTSPAELSSVDGVLEVTLSLQTDVDAAGRQRYCYLTPAGQVDPTLRVNAGDTLLIHFSNNLPAGLNPAVPAVHDMASMTQTSSTAPSHTSARGGAAGLALTLHPATSLAGDAACLGGAMSASASNLHFHGLNVAPVCHADEVVNTLVQPGQEFDYSVQIPTNEPAGLYWYHPHPHGFSEGQVQGGATGAILVNGIQQANSSLLGLPEQTLVLRDQLVPLSQQSAANVPAWDLSLDNVPVSFPAYTPAVLPVAPGQRQLWRILNSSADSILDLQYTVNGVAQMLTVAGIDGVPITTGNGPNGTFQETSALMPPGSRLEVVVTTPALGQTAQLTTSYVNTGPDGDYDPTRPIANVVASASAPVLPVLQAVAAGSTSKSAGGAVQRFAALPQAVPVAQRTLYFSEQLSDPTDPNSPTTFFITQDGMTPTAYTMGQAPNIVVHSGTVEDWVIQNRALEDHIFHIHQIHFQVMAVNGVAVNDPAIRDTYDLPYWTGQGAYPSITVRMDFRDPNIVGTFVYHCHILQHEDAGMMGAIEVLPAAGAASTTLTTSSNASTAPAASTMLTASVVSSVAGGSTPTGQVQFQDNGVDLGNPVTLVNGVATLSVLGTTLQNGVNIVKAFYMGDAYYGESLSAATQIADAPFSLSASAATGALGAATNASLNLMIANGYTGSVQLACTLPASLTEAACFVNPSPVVGGGPVTLTINTTPPHPAVVKKAGMPMLPAGGVVLSLLALPVLRRRRFQGPGLVSIASVFVLGSLLILAGCSGSGSATNANPGTPAGTYMVVVTATGTLAGATPYTQTVNVPVTVH